MMLLCLRSTSPRASTECRKTIVGRAATRLPAGPAGVSHVSAEELQEELGGAIAAAQPGACTRRTAGGRTFQAVAPQRDKYLLDDEAVLVGGANHSHATKDLYDAIAQAAADSLIGARPPKGLAATSRELLANGQRRGPSLLDGSSGDYPEWTLMIQTMDPADEDKFDFDPLDVTKTWPESLFPLQPIGRMVLNRNVDNFFNENEQIAFCPAIIVPGARLPVRSKAAGGGDADAALMARRKRGPRAAGDGLATMAHDGSYEVAWKGQAFSYLMHHPKFHQTENYGSAREAEHGGHGHGHGHSQPEAQQGGSDVHTR
ncbi:Catalase isozyme 2, partial [Tetrabaena socialis]